MEIGYGSSRLAVCCLLEGQSPSHMYSCLSLNRISTSFSSRYRPVTLHSKTTSWLLATGVTLVIGTSVWSVHIMCKRSVSIICMLAWGEPVRILMFM